MSQSNNIVSFRIVEMKIYLISLYLISFTNLVRCGYLTGHHPLPPNLITSRTLVGGAVGGGPSSGAYSSSHLTQTVSTSPTHIQSAIATYHPSQYGYTNRENQGSGSSQGSGYNQGQFSPNQGQNQGYGQNQGGYNTNIPSVGAYGSYGYGNQGQSGRGSQQGQGGQGDYYQGQQYGYNLGHGPNNYGRY